MDAEQTEKTGRTPPAESDEGVDVAMDDEMLGSVAQRLDQELPPIAEAEESDADDEELDEEESDADGEEELDEEESDDGDGEEDEDDDRGLDPETQEIVNRRIGKEVRKRKEAKEALEAAEAERDEMRGELEELKSAGSKDRAAAVAKAEGVHPLMGAESEREIRDYEDFLDEAEDFAEEHAEYGYEGDGTEKDPSFSAEQLKGQLKQIRRLRRRVIPAARERLQQRKESRERAQEQYPDIYRDGKMVRAAKAVLDEIPGLRLIKTRDEIVGQILAGRGKTGKVDPKRKSGKTKQKRRPPLAGGGHRSASKRKTGKTKPSGGIKLDAVASGEDGALADQVAKLI